MKLSAAVTLAVVSSIEAGCYWAVPSCDEHADATQDLVYASARVGLEEGDAFSIDGRRYTSCFDLCREQAGVERVVECRPPAATGVAHADGTHDYEVSCRVDRLTCENAEIIGGIGGGRPFEGFVGRARSARAGAWLAEMARLEAASVPAFARLASELAHHGAPADLVTRAEDARVDEIRHAAIVSSLARRYGARPARVIVPNLPSRSFVRFAVENAVVGCVEETLGAALAAFQARRAEDRAVRRAMACIARDELRHAILAWDVFAWSLGRASGAERARIEGALSRAMRRASGASWVVEPDARTALGLPAPWEAERILATARMHLGGVEADPRRVDVS